MMCRFSLERCAARSRPMKFRQPSSRCRGGETLRLIPAAAAPASLPSVSAPPHSPVTETTPEWADVAHANHTIVRERGLSTAGAPAVRLLGCQHGSGGSRVAVLDTSRTKRPEGGGPDAGDVGKTGGELPSSPAPPSPPDPPPLRRPGGSSEARPGDGGGRGARQLRVRAGGCVTCHTRDGLVPAAVSRPQSQAAPLSRPPSSQAFPGVCRFRTRGTIACAQLLAGPPFLSPVLAATPAGWARRGKKRKRGPRRWRWGQLPSSRGAPRWSRRTSRRASPPPSPQPSPADVKCVSQPPPLSPDPSSPPCPPPGPSCRRRRSHPSPRLPSSGGNPCHRRRTTGSPFPLSCISSSSLHPPVFSPPALSRTRWREL